MIRLYNLEVLRQEAYTYWRDASNYITNTLLKEAYRGYSDIAHGTTFTGAAVPEFLQNLQEAGYTTTILLSFAPETFVKNSIEYRNEKIGFFQASEVVLLLSRIKSHMTKSFPIMRPFRKGIQHFPLGNK